MVEEAVLANVFWKVATIVCDIDDPYLKQRLLSDNHTVIVFFLDDTLDW